jgi:hypothetical protein
MNKSNEKNNLLLNNIDDNILEIAFKIISVYLEMKSIFNLSHLKIKIGIHIVILVK